MSRKDTILIAVIINAGLLAILFATAIIYDTEKEIDQSEFDATLAEVKVSVPEQTKLVASHVSTVEDKDNAPKKYVEPSPSLDLEQEQLYFSDPESVQSHASDDVEEQESLPVPQGDYVDVTVKKGDSLEKIARANGTTISAIKKANHLTNERLSIGQVLKIPLKKEQPPAVSVPAVSKPVENSGAVYHTVKSGDSPWKIAKQYGVKYEDILILNQLDEDKARNLKIGDRIRVK